MRVPGHVTSSDHVPYYKHGAGLSSAFDMGMTGCRGRAAVTQLEDVLYPDQEVGNICAKHKGKYLRARTGLGMGSLCGNIPFEASVTNDRARGKWRTM
jgi:hypothetical protein